tara:strand:- start:279 stop:953 length:675 start_codon:yes stop_codon:yes gene_type:complete
MQKVDELNLSIDSLETRYENLKKSFAHNFIKTNGINFLKFEKNDNIFTDSIINYFKSPFDFMSEKSNSRKRQILFSSSMNVKGIIQNINSKKKNFFIQQKLINLHKSSFYDKYTIGFGVFFLFLIGAALGAIIRKGGLGLPVVLSILIFLSYHYIGLFGKNAAEDSSISPFVGSWISILIVGIFALYLSKQASSDRGITDFDRIQEPLMKLIDEIKKKYFKINK